MIGTRLGPYEITAKLGEGGMGVVFKAKDSHLGRDVALKVLPEGFTQDPERLARFEREAQLLAQLNHPNIAQIYGLEKSGETRALVLELVDGPTLAERLEQGPLPFNESLSLSLQIAHALEEAHEKGIVHRDLKPQNVKASIEGKVKVLDFGLAKAMDPAGAASGPGAGSGSPAQMAQSPTLTLGATVQGMILGTAAYMSPEQAKGLPVDKRADIWAFGVVVYEMLTGRQLFAGDSVTETLASVLRNEIDFAALPETTPVAVRQLLRRCLERNPRNRLHDIADARIVLEEVVAGRADDPQVAVIASPSERRAPGRGTVALLIAVAAIAAATAIFVALRATPAKPTQVGAAEQPTQFAQLTETRGIESSPTLSPDGKDVVYVSDAKGNRDLFLLRVGGRNPAPLSADSPVDDWQPAFSPDGERIAFRSERGGGGIFLMTSTGESVRRLTDFGFSPSWSPDGKEIAVATSYALYPSDLASSVGDLWAVDVATGERRLVSKGANAQRPAWSPHGNRIAYWTRRAGTGQRDLFTVASDGSGAAGAVHSTPSTLSTPSTPPNQSAVDVTNDEALDWCPVWSPDGRFLYFSSSRGGTMNLWRVAIDEASGQPSGAPQPVTVPSAYGGELSFAKDGRRFAYASLDWRSTLFEVDFDARSGAIVGAPRAVLESNRPIRDHQVSPDGQWVAMTLRGAVEDIALARLDNSRYLRLTDDPFRDRGPIWSPDGSRIAFYSDRSGSYQMWSIRPDGSGLERLTGDEFINNFGAFAPDGAQLALGSIGQGWRLLDMRSTARPMPSRAIPPPPEQDGDFWPFSWSRDGTKLAGGMFFPDGSARGVAVYTLADGRYEQVSGGSANRNFLWVDWLSDSRRLLVRMEHGISLLDTVTKESKPLISVGGYWIGASAGVTKDDRKITWTETATEGDVWIAEMGGGEAKP